MKLYGVLALLFFCLAGALWYVIDSNVELNSELKLANADLQKAQELNEDQSRKLADIRAERDRLVTRLGRLRDRERKLETLLAKEQQAREQLEAKDEAYRNWANTDLPDGAVRLLRSSPLYQNNGVPPLSEREGSGDQGASPLTRQPPEEPRPRNTDRPVRSPADPTEQSDGRDRGRG